MDQYIGKLLDNRYEILEQIGLGGMARVFRARDHRLNRLVAIKVLREDLAQDAEFRRRFHDESQAVAMLSHPNIVAVYDVSRTSELEYIVMELIDGITLKQYMQKKGNKLNWREALHFITQIVKALGHAHSRGIIHRDIKPQNIMVLRDGSVKVADFGIARVASGGHSTLTQEALGSVHYISPEQARGSHIDARSDLYSAGVVLYEMLTGRLPFEGDTPVSVAIQHINSIPLSPRELEPAIPEALEAITMKAMAPNPDNRYGSADEMLADLEEFRKNPSIKFDYTMEEFPLEEPDDDRTQIRPAVTVPRQTPRDHSPREGGQDHRRGHGAREEGPEEDGEEDLPARGPIWPIALAVVGVLLFVGLVFAFLWRSVFASLFTQPPTYEVPSVVGQLYEEAAADHTLLQDRFTLVEGETVSDESDPGTILEQSPEAGTEVGESVTEITVTISGGPETITMIDLYDMDYTQAYKTLVEMGLKPQVPEYEYHEEIQVNHIISYTPLEGVVLSPGDEVELVVSRGPERRSFEMPNLVDMTLETARSTIDTYNLTHGSENEVFDDTIEAGHVVSQYPVAGAEVSEGSQVNLLISKGPDPNAQQEPVEATRTIYIDLPLDADGILNLRVLMDGEEIYNQDVDASMQTSVPVTVTGSGVKFLTVYINGIESGVRTIDFSQPEAS